MPPNDLDLWLRNPKFNRDHLLVMTNHHTKFEDHSAMSSLVIDRTRCVYGTTDRHTNQRTDRIVQSNKHPLLWDNGHHINKFKQNFSSISEHRNNDDSFNRLYPGCNGSFFIIFYLQWIYATLWLSLVNSLNTLNYW